MILVVFGRGGGGGGGVVCFVLVWVSFFFFFFFFFLVVLLSVFLSTTLQSLHFQDKKMLRYVFTSTISSTTLILVIYNCSIFPRMINLRLSCMEQMTLHTNCSTNSFHTTDFCDHCVTLESPNLCADYLDSFSVYHSLFGPVVGGPPKDTRPGFDPCFLLRDFSGSVHTGMGETFPPHGGIPAACQVSGCTQGSR